MTTKNRRLALAGGAVVLLTVMVWGFMPLFSGPAEPIEVEPLPPTVLGSPTATSTPVDLSTTPPTGDSSRRTYAVGLHELAGLSPDSPPGTELELFVTWEPPVTRTPRVQLLVKDVRLERLIPPVLPEGPTTALLSLPTRDVPDLLYGDRFGQLSAVTR